MMKRDYKILAVDFDGTICYSDWPKLGDANEELIHKLIVWKKAGNKLILWTCREGSMLDEAVTWSHEQGLVFDAINDNLPEMKEFYGGNSRKITADYYLDDKAVNIANMETNKRNKNGKGIPGMPQYTYGDTVTFKFDRGGEYTVHTGKIVVVDSYGSLEFHMEQPSYDIEVEMDDGGHCLMKHVPESDILLPKNQRKSQEILKMNEERYLSSIK